MFWASTRITGLPFSPTGIFGVLSGTVKSSVGARRPLLPESPVKEATWPLPGAKKSTPRPGVTHYAVTAPDGTSIDFFDFNFKTNPRLKWEIYDQDENDEKPLDNHVFYAKQSVAGFTKAYNNGKVRHRKAGRIVAAWNGAFFGYYDAAKTEAFHVSPVVINGKVVRNTVQHRWTFGVKADKAGTPEWKVLFKPDKAVLEKEFDFAAGSVQCLIKDGKPLKVEPAPAFRDEVKKQPVPSTANEAGHIPFFDHMKTCRASIGWSRDNRHLYLLVVKEPDFEAGSSVGFSQGVESRGGWTVADVQRFWRTQGAWGAINSDAGDVAQLVFQSGNKTRPYTYVPPRQASGLMRYECPPNWYGTPPGGGALMYFYVTERK